jgi:hypothetical protein
MNALPKTMKALCAAVVVCCAALTLPTVWVGGSAQAQSGAAATEAVKVGDKVKLTLSDGRVIEGEVVSVTPEGYEVKFKASIGMSTVKFLRSEITKIEKSGDGASKPATAPAASQPGKAEPGKSEPAKAEDPANGEAPTRIYMMTLRGEIGRDVSKTPMAAAIADAKKQQPDVLVITVDTNFQFQGQQFDPRMPNPRATSAAYQQLETVRELGSMLVESVRDDSDWRSNTPTGKPKLVMWVKNAVGGAAFMPWIAKDIYMASNGRWGGIGYIEYIYGAMGDRDPREKQFSLRLARARSLAELGDHEPRLIQAMSRMQYVLSVSYVGGKPVYYESTAGDELLTDDGDAEAGRRDRMEDVMRLRGDDCLNLTAPLALKLQVTRATVDNVTELANEMGIARNYVELKGKSDQIFREWSKDVDEAEEQFRKLVRDFQRVEVGGNTREERNRGRSQQLAILNRVGDLLTKYKEAINPAAIDGAPEEWFVDIEIIKAQIKQQIRLDR